MPENQEVDLVGDVPVDDGTPQEDLASEVPLPKTLESKPDPSATNLITEAELVSEAPVTGREPQNHGSQRPATMNAITETDILKFSQIIDNDGDKVHLSSCRSPSPTPIPSRSRTNSSRAEWNWSYSWRGLPERNC